MRNENIENNIHNQSEIINYGEGQLFIWLSKEAKPFPNSQK